MLCSGPDLQMHVQNVRVPPLEIGPQNCLFLNGFFSDFVAYFSLSKRDRLPVDGVQFDSYILSNFHELWSTNG